MTDFTLPAHVSKLWLVRVTDTAGQVLPPGGFEFYGCATAPRCGAVAMVAEARGDATELVLPGLCAPGAWDLSIFCREVATGVTWAVQQGRVNVTPSPGLPCGGVVPAVDELVAVLDPVTHVLSVELGDSTASAAANARLAEAAREGADEAAARAAADAARVEELKRVTLDEAAGAALDAERAEDSKRGAEAAKRDAQEAKVVAEDASAQAGRYAAQAVGGADGAVLAQGKAEEAQQRAEEAQQAAEGERAGAEQAAGDAESRMLAAQEAEREARAAADRASADKDDAEQAKADALAAQGKAEQEAAKAEAKAALLGDAALRSGDNTFAGSNVFKGGFHVEGNATISHFVDITGFRNDAETCYRAAEGWFGEVLTLKVDNVSGVQRAGQFFQKMKELFGVSTSLKKIYVFSDGAAFYNWIFYDALIACPNVKVLVNRAENATGTNHDDWNIYGLKNVDYIEYYAPKALISLSGFSYANEIAKVLKVEAKTVKAKGCYALKDNSVRIIRTSEQTDATHIFYSKDGALKVASVVDGFWDKITKADGAFYGAKNLLSVEMYPQALPVLTQAANMFAGCELPADYVVKLLRTLPTYTSGTHELGLGIHVDHQADDEVLESIAEAEKNGWSLTVQWNGTPTASASVTYGLRKPTIYARVNEEERPDGTTERVLDWGHYVTDPTGYEEFRSVEAASEYFGLPEEDLTETE